MVDFIKPSIGRKVWYIPGSHHLELVRLSDQPFDATIVHVNSDTSINVVVFDHTGASLCYQNVPINVDLINPVGHCEWMPYQVGQAKRHEGETKSAG